MIKYFKVLITETSKPMGNNREVYRIFNQEEEGFKTFNEAKKWLDEKYNNVKKVKMFRDNKNGEPYQSGWIYCFKNRDWSHMSNWWWQQDWIEIKEVKEKIII